MLVASLRDADRTASTMLEAIRLKQLGEDFDQTIFTDEVRQLTEQYLAEG